jgi:hypothetical protein
MPTDHPTIDLRGYERLRDLERQVSYSPVIIALVVIGCVGLGVLGYGLHAALDTPDPGLGVPLTGFVFIAASVGGLSLYFRRRLARLQCPRCAGNLQPYLVDLPDGCLSCLMPGFEIDGRYYCHPFGDEDDRRPFVRLMKVARACEPCRTYLDCSQYHQQTCLEDDLERVRRRFPNYERELRRRQVWLIILAGVLSGALLLSLVLMFMWHRRG